jgi:hypothetical protein
LQGLQGGQGPIGAVGTYVISVNSESGTLTDYAKTNAANKFTLLNTFDVGLSANAGATFASSIDHTFGNTTKGLRINAGKAISDIFTYGNETLTINAVGGNGYGNFYATYLTLGDDNSNNGTQIYIDDNASDITYLASGKHDFTGKIHANTGITAAGATFSSMVAMGGNTLYQPTLRYYNEPTSSPTISAGTLTLDLSAAQIFTVSLNAAITTLTISNTPATASRAIGFTLIFTADGTARSVTWGGSILWPSGTAPTLTSTNNKRDAFSFITTDGGTTWLGFVGGQNF